MADLATIIKDLSSLYQPLLGARFTATYQGISDPLPQFGNLKDILAIEASNHFFLILQQILSNVVGKYGKVVWKGITGPHQGLRFTRYQLWGEPEFNGKLQAGLTTEFTIVDVNVSQYFTGTFGYGVKLKAAVPDVKIMAPTFGYCLNSFSEKQGFLD